MPQANPASESCRLRALDEYQILDTAPEEVYDRVVGLAAEICETPIALFSLVDADRLSFKASYGPAVKETPREASFCALVVDNDRLLVVEDARSDERFAANELVSNGPRVRFYAGAPVRAHGGEPLGTLCVLDREPRQLAPERLRLLEVLARELETHLEARRSLMKLREAAEERAVQAAMVAHDAQNLMTVIRGALELATPADAESAEDLAHARGALDRLVRMCENFLTASAAGGAEASRVRSRVDLAEWLPRLQRRESAHARHLGIDLTCNWSADSLPVEIDEDVLDRVVTNLLQNAFEACGGAGRVRVLAEEAHEGQLRLTVEDDGPGIAPELRELVFEPYFSLRGKDSRGRGLGLAFCRMAIEELGGQLQLDASESGGARFRITLPRAS